MNPGRGTGSPKSTKPAQDCTQGSDQREEEEEEGEGEEEDEGREADWKNK